MFRPVTSDSSKFDHKMNYLLLLLFFQSSQMWKVVSCDLHVSLSYDVDYAHHYYLCRWTKHLTFLFALCIQENAFNFLLAPLGFHFLFYKTDLALQRINFAEEWLATSCPEMLHPTSLKVSLLLHLSEMLLTENFLSTWLSKLDCSVVLLQVW